uniref:Uncharacterized protein n=1 Tax=Rhizophora mucronata TaxID=61149 RepID=A0A2P2PQJ8_RHIMU
MPLQTRGNRCDLKLPKLLLLLNTSNST